MARLTVARKREPLFRTAAVAKRPDLASAALGGQGIALVSAEFLLLGRGHHLLHVRLVNITEQEARLDKMIAGIEIAIGLQRGTKAAGRGMDA